MPKIPTTDEINQMLASSEQDELKLLHDAVDAATNTILVTDPSLPDNPIVYINRGFERLTGYAASEILGTNCRFLQGADTDQTGVALLRDAIAAAKPVVVELRNYRKDGTMFWNELHVTPIFKHGKLRYFFGVQHDITERKATEALLHKAQASLLEHNLELQHAFEDKSAYVATALQQLARPMTTILGFLDVLAEQVDGPRTPDEAKQYLAIVKQAAEGMNTELGGLLELTSNKHAA